MDDELVRVRSAGSGTITEGILSVWAADSGPQ